jgi:hypothetical protein
MSKYGDALDAMDQDRERQSATVANVAQRYNPDQYAQAISRGSELDVPARIVADNPQAFERKSKYGEALDAQDAPTTQEWMSKLDNAAVAQDDRENLSGLERAMRLVRKGYDFDDRIRERISLYPRAGAAGGVQATGSSVSGVGRLLEAGGRLTERGVRSVPGGDWLADVETPWWMTPGSILRRPGEAVERQAERIDVPEDQQGIDTDIVKGVGQIGAQVITQWLTGGTGSSLTLFGQGADVMGDRAEAAGATPEQTDTAVLAGASITALTERYGLDALLNRVPPQIKNQVLSRLADIAVGGGIEAAQEAVEGVLHNLTAQAVFDPNAPIFEGIGREATAAGGAGAIARAVLGAIVPGRQMTFADQDRAAAEQIATIAQQSKLAQRSPAKLEELVSQIKAQTGSEFAYLDPAAFRTLYQSDQEAAQAAADLTGSPTTYFEAAVSNTKMAVPMEKYVARIAANKNALSLVDHVTFTPDGMTAEEAKTDRELLEGRAKEIAEREVTEARPDSSQAVYDDVLGQLLGTGMERSTAEKNAALTQAVFRTLGQRTGIDAQQLYQRYGLKVQRHIPGAGTISRVDATIDPLIDQLRAGDVPSPQQAFGTSLLEFIRANGGLTDEGGELAALDIDKGGKAFQRNIIQKDGRSLDDMAEQLVEAGYISERDPNLVLDLISKELSGSPVYAAGNVNEAGANRRAQLEWMEELIGRGGIDLKTADNETIKKALNLTDERAALLDYLPTIDELTESGLAGVDEAFEVALVTRATELDAALVERLAVQYGEDDKGFISAVRAFLNEQDAEAAPRSEESSGTQEGLTSFDQSAQTDPLVTLHNLSAENLTFADKIGGLPVPSLGITKADSPFSGFGDITLIGTRSLAEPSEQNPVFSADAYTQRFPDVIWPKVPGKKAQKFLDSFGESYQQRDTDQVWDELVNSPDRDKAIESFQRSATAMRAWLREQGETPAQDVNEQREPPSRAGWASQKAWVDGVLAMKERGVDLRDLGPDHPEWKELSALARQAVDAHVEQLRRADVEVADSVRELYEDGFEDGSLVFGVADRAISYALNTTQAPRVDRQATRQALEDQIGERREQFNQWATEKVAALFSDPSIKLNGRKVPMTLENIVQAMTSRVVRGKEKTMTFGGGQVAAANSKQFQTLEEIQANRDKVVDPKAHEDAKKSTEKLLEQYRNAVLPHFTEKNWRGQIDTWAGLDASMKALADASKKAPTATNIRASLQRNGFKGVDDAAAELGAQALKAVRQTVVDYFEAKPQRAVSLSEFAGAVIPKSSSDSVREALRNAGVPFTEYESGDNAQTEAVSSFARQLQGERDDILFQRFNETRRGAIQFGADRQFTISLLEKADLSTFLHESGHLYLEIMADLAEDANAPQQVKDDFAKILKWMGVKDRASIQTDQHEQWARGFEQYLMEGKAPSVEMQSVFARFRAWLVGVYRTLARLNVNLTDDVRRVMDRMVATDDEINAAEESQNYAPIFTSAEQAGMSPEEWAAYKDIATRAHQEATQEMTDRFVKQLSREQKAWWKEERAKVRDEVLAEVNEQPVYRALAFLQKGTNADGSSLPDGIQAAKLNKAALVEKYGKDFLKRLPRGLTAKDGLSADVAAAMFGFDSGDALVEALANARPKTQLIEMEADARMREKYGDMLTDGSIAEQAMQSVHTEGRAKVMAAELKALNRKRKEVKPFVKAAKDQAAREQRQAREANAATLPDADELKAIKAGVQRIIQGKKVRDIQPNLYKVAEAKAARKAFEFAGKGKFEEAYIEKRRQILNHELYRAAVKAREEVDGIVDYMRTFDKKATRERIAKAKGQFLEQIDAIRERFDFSNVSNVADLKRTALAQWVAEQEAAGREVNVPEYLLNEARKTPYKELLLAELQGLHDAVANIEHLAKTKDRLLKNRAEAQWQDAKQEIDERIEGQKGKAPPVSKFERSNLEEYGALANEMVDSWLRPETIVEWLDGGESGPLHDYLMEPLNNAEYRREQLREQVLKPLRDLAENVSKQRRVDLHEDIEIKALGKTWDRRTLLSIVLNMGNASNLERLTSGGFRDGSEIRQFTPAALQEIVSKLNAEDVKFLNTAWATVEQLWPEVVAFQKRMGGLVPEKIQATPIQTPHGALTGGYWPAVYDSLATRAGQAQAESTDPIQTIMGANFTRASTKKGHLKGRTAVAGPLLLDYAAVAGRHVEQVITDITHREVAMQAMRILDDKDLRLKLQDAAGETAWKSLRGMVRHAVEQDGGFSEAANRGQERMMRRLLSNTGLQGSDGVGEPGAGASPGRRASRPEVHCHRARSLLSPPDQRNEVHPRLVRDDAPARAES